MTRSIFSEGFPQATENAYAAFEVTPSFGRKRLFVLSIQGLGPAAVHNIFAGAPAYSPLGIEPDIFNALPLASRAMHHGTRVVTESSNENSYWARPVLGQVVRNTEGHLCEWTPQGPRSLGRVVRGPQGQLLELMPVQQQGKTGNHADEIIDGEVVETASPLEPGSHENAAPPVPAQKTEKAPFARSRKFFAEPGLPRIIEFGRFRSLLADQLSHPERLRGPHRLACHVQVYQALIEQRADEFFAAVQGNGPREIPIRPLTEEAIALLGLAPFLSGAPRPATQAPKIPGTVQRFEHFFTMRIASDPTADAASAVKASAPVAADITPKNQVAEAPAKASAPSVSIPARLAEIPSRFQNPWEFPKSRDEVLYDMSMEKLSRGSFRKFLSRIGGWFQRREEFRKWRALLGTKNMEDQLWSVRPPRGSTTDETILDWARQTLELAGYDVRTMLLEWEIFWRRKGV